jgi:hypothetical protein
MNEYEPRHELTHEKMSELFGEGAALWVRSYHTELSIYLSMMPVDPPGAPSSAGRPRPPVACTSTLISNVGLATYYAT